MKNYPDFLVSINCMTYNHAPFIKDTMDGFCMQQTTFPYVAIIIDDASTDGEPDVIRSYLNTHFNMDDAREWETDDAHFVYARHKENDNCYFAVILLKYNFYSIKRDKKPLYKEFEETAQYIAMCEGDDYWIVKDKLQMQVNFLQEHRDYVLCCHDYKVYFENKGDFLPFTAYQNLSPKPFTITLDNFFLGDYTQPLTCLYRNLPWEKLIPRDYNYYRDRVFFYYVLKEGNGYIIPSVMGVYRKHSGGLLTGTQPIKNFEIYLSIALQIYIKESDSRALQLYKRHVIKLLEYRWMNNQKGSIIKDIESMFRSKVPAKVVFTIIAEFIKSLFIGKINSFRCQRKCAQK